MSLETRSFLVGIATVAGLVVVGFGGGILMGGVLSGDNKPNKIERQAAAKDEKPALPVVKQGEAPTRPVPVVEADPTVTASPAEQAPTPAAPPPPPQPVMRAEAPPQQPPAQPEQATAGAAATSVGSSLNSDLTLGPEKPVALTQPADQARSLSRREEARIRNEQRRAERELRREERRKLIAERRERDLLRREEARSERLKRPDFEDDNEDERPVAREPALPRAPDLPFFRIFGGN